MVQGAGVRTWFMGLKRGPTMILHFLFIFSIVALPLQGLELFDPEEVKYIRSNLTVAVGGFVTLLCGSPPPHIFIWGFTKPGTVNNVAVAFNYGHGPKVQPASSELGQLSIPKDTSSLQIENVQAEAQGMFTCQALYDEEQGLRATFYFTKLSVVDEAT